VDYIDSKTLAVRLYSRVEIERPTILRRLQSAAREQWMGRLRNRIARALERRGAPYPEDWRDRPEVLRLLDPPMTVEEICGPRGMRCPGVEPKTVSAAKRILPQERHLKTWDNPEGSSS